MAITQQGLTLEEFLRLPEEEPALEYFDGEVTQKVSPNLEHSALQSEFVLYLDRLLRPSKLARVFPELRTSYAGASPVPDISVYRWERVPRTVAGRLARDARTSPDLAIEIRSPGQTVRELAKRCEWYVAHGVPVALLVDPRRETIRVFRPGEPCSVQRAGDRIALDELAPGLELVVTDIFAALSAD